MKAGVRRTAIKDQCRAFGKRTRTTVRLSRETSGEAVRAAHAAAQADGRPTAQKCDVPAGFIPADANAFYVVNPNQCWVRLTGSRGTYAAVTEETGWLLPPGFAGVFGTQKPEFMSTLAVERPGFPLAGLTYAPLEIRYGMGP